MRFIGVVPEREITSNRGQPLEPLLDRVVNEIRSHDLRVDAVVGYFDFPISTMLPLVKQRLGLTTPPSLQSVLGCEHKYWSRRMQKEVVPEVVPAFELVDPFDPDATSRLELAYPFWIKPIKSASSYLGFRIDGPEDLDRALNRIREEIHRLGESFDAVMRHADLPSDIAAIGGYHCIAEEIIGGHQCTLEGYVFDKQTTVYGVVDSLRYPGTSSFARYQYPSSLPESVKDRMKTYAARVLGWIGLDRSPFNAEFYWDEERDRIWLLEINARISQSHSFLFMSVDGASHHEVMLDCALGRRPAFSRGQGSYPLAAKFMVRVRRDATVVRAPDAEELARIEDEIPGTRLQLTVSRGHRLSTLENQDSYSFEVAYIHVAAHDEAELIDKYRNCLERIDLRLMPVEPDPVGRSRIFTPAEEHHPAQP